MFEGGDEEVDRLRQKVGRTLRDKWRLDALLGVGGMAAVYSATHRMGLRAAIKILHGRTAVSKELRARFEQEAMAITKLGHAGTVQVLDIDTTEDGFPFLVMELLDGESMGQRAQRGSIGETELLGHVEQLLDVLVAAHAAGIVHRDIKLDNLFLTSGGRLKVLDFGIARMKETGSVQTRTGAMLGTTAYMAPEQIHGRPVDGRADVFSTGATMFRVLANRRVHEGATDAELLIKMGSSPAPALLSVAPHVDPRVARIVDRALMFDRDERYPDASTMLADVRAVLRGEDAPFASARAAGADVPTHHGLASSPHPVSAPQAVPAVSADLKSLGDAPTLYAATSAGYVPIRTQVKKPLPRTAVLVGAVALAVAVLGTIAAVVLVSRTDAPSSDDTEREEEPRARSRKTAPATSSARPAESTPPSKKKKLRGKDLQRELDRYYEEKKRKKGSD